MSHMIYPLCTVLDDSIGCALWFAARGEGLLHRDQRPPIRYQSQARVGAAVDIVLMLIRCRCYVECQGMMFCRV